MLGAVASPVRSIWARVADRLDPSSEVFRQETERAEALRDVRSFARHVKIQDAFGQEQAFGEVGWGWQFALLALWAITKLSVVLKARQLGVSWLAAIYVLWAALRLPGQAILLISKQQDDANKLLAKVAYIYERLPVWAEYSKATINTESMTLPNKSEIQAMPAKPGVGRSRTANVVVLDEHAHQPWARQILLSISAAVEKGQVISISSPNGQGALHTQLYESAKKAAGMAQLSTDPPERAPLPIRISRSLGRGWRAIFIPFDAHPERDAAWRESKRDELNQLSDAEFTQEYPRDDVEAIQVTGRPVFGIEDLKYAMTTLRKGKSGEPGLVIYEAAQPDHVYVIGADVSEGLERSDYCSAWVLDRDSGEQVALMRGRWTPDVYAMKLDRLARMYGEHAKPDRPHPVILAVERNNHGHAVLLRLVQLVYGAPYALFRAKDKRRGWLTTPATRPVLVDQLEAALRLREITIRDAGSLDQFTTFHWNDDGKPEGQEGAFDDDVMAAGIAWQVRRRSFGRVIGAELEAKAA